MKLGTMTALLVAGLTGASVSGQNVDSIVAVSERVGETVDSVERREFEFFPGIEGFKYAHFVKTGDGLYAACIRCEADDRDTTIVIPMCEEEFLALRGYIDAYTIEHEAQIGAEVIKALPDTAHQTYEEGNLDGKYAANARRRMFMSRGTLYSAASTCLSFAAVLALADEPPRRWYVLTSGAGLLGGSIAVVQAMKSSGVPQAVPKGTMEYEQGYRQGYAAVSQISKVRSAAEGTCLGTAAIHGIALQAAALLISLLVLSWGG